MLVGVDIGGTFTDFCLSLEGRLSVLKLASTPRDPAQAMLAGLAALSPQGLQALQRVSHGSTVATNAILERKGAATALITTLGFRDILAIGRQDRPHLYALQPHLPPALIPRRWCYEVPERLDPTGAVLRTLDLASLDLVLDDIADQGIESIAVCFLYSYLNPTHEHLVRARVLERGLLPEERIALSCEVLPEFREYERASTVALEAYVRPVMSGYLGRLEAGLAGGDLSGNTGSRGSGIPTSRGSGIPTSRGSGVPIFRGSGVPTSRGSGIPMPPSDAFQNPHSPTSRTPLLRIMKSDGGVVSAQRARRRAVQTALSGPAAGVIGGFGLARLAGHDRVITLDMGGTSTDVSLCAGALNLRARSEIDGLPLRTRLLDIETIGAGGGSIAQLDAGGVLRVGPQSAGAEPGPVAYGRGGTQVTVTDANLLLGRLSPDHFLGGAMDLHVELARAALKSLAVQMGVSARDAALGVIEVANTNIDRALRRVSVARGHDPREFVLLPFGGAGPLHACEVADRLEIPRLLIPRYPGILCALGLLMSDVILESSRSVLCPLGPGTGATLWTQLDAMVARAREDLAEEGVPGEVMVFRGFVDARYRGQSYELTVPFAGPSTEALLAAFRAAYEAHYGHSMPEREVEVVNLRLQATGLVDKLTLESWSCRENDGQEALLGQGQVVCDRRERAADLYDRVRLRPGAAFDGPALVFQMDSTVYVAPGWAARVDAYFNLLMGRVS